MKKPKNNGLRDRILAQKINAIIKLNKQSNENNSSEKK